MLRGQKVTTLSLEQSAVGSTPVENYCWDGRILEDTMRMFFLL